MSLKEKFDKAGLTGTTVALPKGKIKDGSGDEKDYKTSKETKKLVKESQTKDAKVIKTPGALVKGASFANQAEKKKTRANTAADKISGFAGSFLASANANTLGTNAKNVSVLADAIAKSRETATGVKTPIAATKGSVFVNKGYDPQNAERSLRETQNLESVSGRANAFAQEMAAKERSIDAEAKKNLGTVGGALYDLGKAGTQLAADAAANILAPGAGLASMGARSFGQGMMTAEEQGKTGARAVAYAAGTAAIEAGTEKISAAAKPLKAIYGAGFVDDALKKLSEKLLGTSKGRQILAEIGRSAAGEGAEEALADVLQVPLQNLTLQNGAKFDAEWVADTAYDALLGGVLGGVLGTAGNIGAIAQTRAEGKGNAKADVIAKAMSNAAQKNAPPVFQQTVQEKGEQAGTNQTDTLYIRKKNPQDTVSNAETNSSPEQNARNVPPQGSSINNIPSSAENNNNNSGGIGSKTQNTGTHIDQRTAQSVGERKVKAFQYEHPEVRPFYQTAAEDLLADADLSTQMPAGSRKERTMQGNRYVHTTQASVPLRYAMDMGLTRGDIMRGAEDIINDEGAENNANAKRVELVLDKMLTEGYSTMFGKNAEPNAEYIQEKQGIPGYREQAQGEELPIWDMTADKQQRSREVLRDNEEATQNDGLGAADRGSLNTGNQAGNSVGSGKSKYSVNRKISQYRLNTLEKILTPEELGRIQYTDFSYQILPDEQVMEQARDRITYQERGEDGELHTVYDIEPEMKYLRESSMWSAEDVVTAGMISKRLKDEAYESGDWSDYNKWEKSCQEHATQLGQALRSFYLYQSDADAAVSNAANVLDKTDLPLDEKNAITSEICSRVDAIMKMQDEQSLIDAIESIACRRGTTKRGMTGILFGKDKGLSKKIRKYLSAMDFDTLQSKALQSAQDMAADYTKRSVGEKVKTIQVMNQLGNLITFERNLVGNFAFGLQDATSNNIAAGLDMILAKFTGTRSQEFNTYFLNKGQREAATKAMQNAIVDIALDIDDISENRYGMTSGRTFKMNGKGITGPMTRFFSTMEKYLSYSLTASDEFFKGGARAGTEQGLRGLYESGKLNIQSDQTSIDGMNNPEVDKFIRDKADEKARYVTFQNNNHLTDITQDAHDALNQLVGIGRKQGRNGKKTHAFGVGDLLMPYTKVPANLAIRSVEYSPVGMANGVKDLVETIISAKKGNLDINQQRKAVQNVSKGINGTVLWAAFAAAALSGAIRNADDQDDEDVAALNAAEGLSGTQVNLDAIARIMGGESAEWQKGDTLIGISFLEPLNAAMAAGTMLAEDYKNEAGLNEYVLDSGNKVFESILETPTMQTINSLYTDMSYGNGIIESVIDASLSSVASSAVPALSRQSAKAGDNNYRDVYSEDTVQGQLLDKLKQNIPGLRQTLPEKLDNFGREKTYTDDSLTNFVNAFLMPGSINTYKQSSVSKTLEKLGDPTLYPQRNAPKSIDVDNEEINLTYNQRQKFQKVRGGTAFSTMSAMTKTSVYKNASKEDRIALLSMCNEYASAIAKDEVISKYELSKRYTNAKESGNPAEFLASVYIYGTDTSGNIDEKVRTAVEQYGMSAGQFTDIRSDLNKIKADKDKNGESIDGTRKKKVIEYLDSMNLTEEQYNYLYHLEYKK